MWGPRSSTARRRLARLAATGLVWTVVTLAVGCVDDGFDREAATAELLAREQGRLTEEQARCFVDRVVDELGADLLAPDAEPSPEQIRRLTSIRVDCIGVANLGNVASTTSLPMAGDVPGVTEPSRLGDDPDFDLLYLRCQAGSGPACDQLFDEAPLGSEYEQFGATCGDRTREYRCADVYPELPPDASVPTLPSTGTPEDTDGVTGSGGSPSSPASTG
jgi:hypothetical protein